MKIEMEDFINSFSLISHSEPQRKLVVHLDEVYKKAKKRFDSLLIDFDNLSISKNEFEEMLKIVVYCHDFGKASFYFQKKIIQEKELEKGEKRLSEHGLISAFFGFFIAREIFDFDKRISSFVFMAIRYHHLNLDDSKSMQFFEENELENILNIYQTIKNNAEEIDRLYKYFLEVENITLKFGEFLEEEFNEDVIDEGYFRFKNNYKENDFLVFNLLFSLLIYADKQDAIFREDSINNLNTLVDSKKVEEFKNEYFKIRDKTPLDEVREKIYQNLVSEYDNNKSNDVFFIKLPTGAGKTLLLYKLAIDIKQKETSRKVFYLLPFITLIEQNAGILKELLDFMDIDTSNNKVFLEKHSLSGEFIVDKSNEEYDIDKKQFLLDTLDSEFIVTSFHQLFYGIFKRKNSLLKRFHQFSNSVILIDEIQLIPLNLMYAVSKFLKFMSEVFNCKIIVASATFPNISKDILSNSYTMQSVDKILSKDEIDKFFNRYVINIDITNEENNLKVYEYKDLFQKINEKLKTKRDLLFRVNTINSANAIYDYLISIEDEGYEKEDIFLLTSAITPYHRKKIISKIKNNSKKGIKQIVVATQLIQAGVDISLEDGIEELAPLDLIIQSMGRRNRSGEKSQIGKADVIIIKNDNGFQGYKIYSDYDIEQTSRILQDYKSISEKEILEYKLLDSYYNTQPEITKIDELFKRLEYKKIDEYFTLISSAPLSFSFFIPINDEANKLWKILKELDEKKKLIEKDKNFWKNMKAIDSEYSKIKKEISLYIVNQNFYYKGSKEKMIFDIISDFESAHHIYLATDEVFDIQKGLILNQYVKDRIEGLFW